MKKFAILLLFIGSQAWSQSLSEQETDLANYELNESSLHMQKVLDGLTPKQLNFKPSPEAWSIAECAEHLAIAETNLFGLLQKSLETPADPSKRSEVKMTDAEVVPMITDRSTKVKTPKPFEPSGKFGSHEDTVKEFLKKRAATMRFVYENEADLRNHYMVMPFGTLDAYQGLLFIAGHTERHVLQMEEVKANANFPKG